MKIVFLLHLLWIVGFSVSPSSSYAQSSPSKFIELLHEEVVHLNSTELTTSQKLAQMSSIIERTIDFSTVVRFILGRNLNRFSPEELLLFGDRYKKCTSQKYAKLMTTKLKYHKIIREENLGSNRYLVHTILEKEEKSAGTPLQVAYLVILKDGDYKVIDIILSGNISMAMADREEISAFLSNNTLKDLREKFA